MALRILYRSPQNVHHMVRTLVSSQRFASTTAKVPFKWDDPLDFQSQLSDEERMIVDSVRSFAQERLMPGITQAYREEVGFTACRSRILQCTEI